MAIVTQVLPLREVFIYIGHTQNPILGPYWDNIAKRIQMFEEINAYRQQKGLFPWKVHQVEGENLEKRLSEIDPKTSLMVIPAGQSSNLDRVFSDEELKALMEFFQKGGRGYLTCGAAYWVSKIRDYEGFFEENPEHLKRVKKESRIPLFKGTAVGPLCSFPGSKYQVGFYSDAVTIINQTGKSCTVFLSGGGSFVLPPMSEQRVRVLSRYPENELRRLEKEENLKQLQNASIMVEVGKGGLVLAMYHPYYGAKDIEVERYEQAFPDSGTNWKQVHNRLSSLEDRVAWVYESVFIPLETLDFEERKENLF